LALHPANQVKGRLRLPSQCHLQQVLLDSRLDRFLHLTLDFKKTIRRAQPADPLVGPAVIVVFYPELQALPRRLERVELRPHQKLLPHRRPEPLHLAQRHRVLRPRHQMRHPVLRQLRGKPALAPPVEVLRTTVRQHFLRGRVFPDGHPVRFHHRFRRRTAVQLEIHHVARVVIQERHRVGVFAAQAEREDVALPHLVWRRPLKITRAHQVPARFCALIHQVRLVERPPDRLRARLQEQPPA
jgi:hypothetical protein